ncbi:hypothetical protein [Methylobacter sp. BlB1]|jgi:hypothetical protein|uniref:hypothetical protein n=1 Tax=Methylobacter sp. BlB1 TaxID=2785914 RepID=UPI001893A0F4|nr:hypothetical protein [Methylobacter sp. BlB1]MBF6650731.1 hypothetical protein [Methylobacter sp. BlB1]
MHRIHKTVMAALALGLQACVPYYNTQDTLKTLAVAECADARRDSSAFNRRKSTQLVQQECEQFLLLDRDYQRSQNKKFHAHPRLTYNDEQAYFDDEAWSLVIERLRETHYPHYLPPEQEVALAHQKNTQQAALEDRSLRRDYTPRLLPVSPYLMNYRELGWATEAIDRLIYKFRADEKIRGKLAAISVIVINERQKKDPFLYRRRY